MKYWLVLLILGSAKLQAQDVVFAGRVVDLEDQEPIALVGIRQSSNGALLAKTDKNGYFHFNFTYTKEEKFVFEHSGFKRQEVNINRRKIRKAVDDTVYLTVKLPWYTLGQVTVRNPAIPDTLFGSEKLSVSDYQFFDDDRLIMLVYEQTLRKSSKIVLVDNHQKILSEEYVPDRAKSLYSDYLGFVNVICENSVYRITTFGNTIRLKRIKDDDFYRYIVPVVDTANNLVYYSNYNPDYPAFEYYAYNPKDSSHTEIMKVEDKPLMELYRAEYKYVDGAEKLWAARQEAETGIDKEIWVGLKYFTNSIYYKSLYAPLFVLDGEVAVFDHYADMMYLYDDQNAPLDSMSIYYHKMKGKEEWDNLVVKDDKTNQVYAIFQNGGYHILSEIDLETGRIKKGHQLYFKYAENIMIRDDKIYYIYRPFESAQKKFLYVEKLGSD